MAKLAGLPVSVITRAKDVLDTLTSDNKKKKGLSDVATNLPLFEVQPQVTEAKPSPTETALNDINPDDLTPREALEALYALKEVSKN